MKAETGLGFFSLLSLSALRQVCANTVVDWVHTYAIVANVSDYWVCTFPVLLWDYMLPNKHCGMP